MRVALVLVASIALAGCARFAERSYGSWLDTYGVPARNPASLSPQAHAELQQLDAQAEALRVKLASEPDRVKRIAYLKELRYIGDQQRVFEQARRFGNTASAPQPGA